MAKKSILYKIVISFFQIIPMKKTVLLNSAIIVLLSISCSKAPELDSLPEKYNPKKLNVKLKGRYWQSMYTPTNSFELKFSNNSESALENCMVIINDQFKHRLTGLKVKMNNERTYSYFEGNTLKGNESVSIMFDQESGNLDKFHINVNLFFKPKTVSLISNSDTIQWLFDLPLHKSYF